MKPEKIAVEEAIGPAHCKEDAQLHLA